MEQTTMTGSPDFSNQELLPAVVQDATTGAVLMLAYMNEEAFRRTRESKLATFYSRSRREIWVKGATSGNYLEVESIFLDCDRDAILLQARPRGPACHTGSISCFGEESLWEEELTRLGKTISDRSRAAAETSYTASLLAASPARRAQKIGEEGVEAALAAAVGDRAALIAESADLVYHLLVALEGAGASLSDVRAELARRRQLPGRVNS